MKEKIFIKSRVKIELFDKNKKLKNSSVVNNLITRSGEDHIADQLSDRTEASMAYMAVGTSTTAASAGDTKLGNELDRNALTSRTQGSGAEANNVVYVCEWAANEAVGAITEAGIFNATTSGIMLCRAVFSPINKAAEDTLKITWTITFGTS